MTKSILLSIRPKHVRNILNGKKTIEIRKKFPKDYVGWVYIYVTKSKPYVFSYYDYDGILKIDISDCYPMTFHNNYNGKIIGRFWCDKVEEIYHEWFSYKYDCYYTTKNEKYGNYNEGVLLKLSCLDLKELSAYLGVPEEEKKVVGYAIHITQLEIFNYPKELGQFERITEEHTYENLSWLENGEVFKSYGLKKIIKAPQNYYYIKGQQNYYDI